MIPFLWGLLASFFFSASFVLNRSMNLAGGDWVWSGVLRFFFMVPLLAVLVPLSGGWKPIVREVRRAPLQWWLWSTVGFGLFYAPVCWASSFGESWLVAGLWQVTIVAGTLLFPSRGQGLLRSLAISGVILAGVALLEVSHAQRVPGGEGLWAGALVTVGAFAYPWGNRRIMGLAEHRLSTVQRVTAMTVLSLPFWTVLSFVPLTQGHLPSLDQSLQCALVALFSGVVATLLFFRATAAVRHNPAALAAVEATQAGEVAFSVLGERIVLAGTWPDGPSQAGLALVLVGLVGQSLSGQKSPGQPPEPPLL